MDKSKRVGVSRWLVVSYSLLISIFILFGVLSFVQYRALFNLTQTIYNHPLAVSNAALQSTIAIMKMQRNMHAVAFPNASSQIQRAIEPANQQEEQVRHNLNIVKKLILGADGQRLENEAGTLFDQWLSLRQEIKEGATSTQTEKTSALARQKSDDLVARLEVKMLELTRYARNKASEFMDQSKVSYSKLTQNLFFFLLLGIVLSAFIAFFSLKHIVSSEKKLRDSEAIYRSLIESQVDLVTRFTPDGTYTYVNRVFCKFFNQSKERLIGSKWQPILVDDDLGVIEKKLSSLSAAHPTVVIENRVRCGEGKVHLIQFVNTGIFNSQGALVEIQSVGRDITALKAAQEGFRLSEDKYRSLVELAQEGIWVIDKDDTTTFVNPSMAKMLGYTTEEMQGKTIFNFMDEQGIAVANADLARRRKGIAEQLDFEFIRKDGLRMYATLATTPVMDEAGAYNGAIAGVIDITSRKLAEIALIEGQATLEAALESMTDAVLISDAEGRFVQFNHAFVTYHRFRNKQECLDTLAEDPDILELYLPDGTLAPLEMWAVPRALRGETEINAEYTLRRKESGESWIGSYSFAPIRDKAGKIAGSVVVARDITEQKRAAQENEKLEARLFQAQKMESVGRLAGGVAHDFNNMLSVISGYVELATEKVALDDPLHDDLQEIATAAERATNITRQLLAFARKQIIAPKVLNLNLAVENMLQMLRRLIGEDIDLVWHPDTGLWPVKVDPSQLDQVLANLCVNARDAISDVGKLTIETHNATFDQAYCADHLGFVPGDFVMLAVSDDGCGMDQETLSHIFEPFFTTKKMDKGTGLGLATVYGIAKQNDGFINIYSEPGQGSTLKIYLPRHEGMIDAMEQTTAAPKPMAHGETILVVEDDAGVLKLAAKILQGLGYTVLTTNTPAKALGLVEAHADRIELLLTDVVMPEMNGRELADQIQALCPQIKILFMSGYTADIIAHRGVLEKGVNFIHKPFSNWDLANAVRNVLDQA